MRALVGAASICVFRVVEPEETFAHVALRPCCGCSLQNLVQSLAPSDATLFKRCYNVLQESLAVTDNGGAPTTSLPKCITSAFVQGSKRAGKSTAGDSPAKKSPKRGKDKNAALAGMLTVKTTGLGSPDMSDGVCLWRATFFA